MSLRQDCIRWLAEVEAALPTVVFAVHGPTGNDVTQVRVSMDGEPFASELTGVALPVDPGQHTFRFETSTGLPTELSVLVREGEKSRNLAVTFPPPPPPVPSPEWPPTAPAFPVIGAVVVGGGVAAGGVGAYFELHGLSQKSSLDACKPNCTETAVTDTRRSFILGDVLIGAGLVSVLGGVYLILRQRHGSRAETSLHAELAPVPGGGFAGVHGRF
jgi:hypothetical protein